MRDSTLQGGFALVFCQGRMVYNYAAPLPWSDLRFWLPSLPEREARPVPFKLRNRVYILASAPSGARGRVAVALPLPESYVHELNQLEQSQQAYRELRLNNKLIRQTYMQALLLITLLVLFGTTWSALALSKLVTRPVTALAPSPARNASTAATSAGSSSRSSGCWAAKDAAPGSRYSRAVSSRIGVAVDPGLTAFAVIPVPRSSAASARTNPATPALAAQ